ncbi:MULTISPECIES: energy transducer TonB [Gammaproteobacteria]|uniref:energy transducer TonB n=1 Tax=Gammaproteobacteria TaxID=1236 RepID=UPI000DCF8259|nr:MULTISPECIES: energy transducer TonB [Gammaproteobacteria]RTE87228.1 hypothetical protein DQX04_02235 [Aliidiomarina sp. B3213]TCZ92984.1 hypothetical protein EYQ95_03070 [Lysobacter sp. N42]
MTFTKIIIPFVLILSFSTTAVFANASLENAVENRQNIQPIIHVGPIYPEEAVNDQIEGYCRVSYDIMFGTLSSPQNIEVLECSPEGVFETSCTESISYWVFSINNSEESEKGLISTCQYSL